jgi:hypothetical protein
VIAFHFSAMAWKSKATPSWWATRASLPPVLLVGFFFRNQPFKYQRNGSFFFGCK